MAKDPFDFSDLSDLPKDLAAKLHTDSDENAREYAAVVLKGAEAGLEELTINQIIAAAMRMKMQVPTQQTVRGYLNDALKLGLISKPSRQTYGPPAAPKKGKAKAETVGLEDATITEEVEAVVDTPVDTPSEVPSVPQEAPAAEPNEEADPLASLGL